MISDGKLLKRRDGLAIARDNQTEDNISRKNKSYCELTAYYC
ncbi:MAG: DUF4422 domain-containing protein, partial [Alphaproteobacteria bacterium]|nr:DUF4422 domain-containing protein [Alphaproteobacteria bacterium]